MSHKDKKHRETVKARFLASLRHHLSGLGEKVERDFSQTNFDRELANLTGDAVYSKFAFNTPEYVLVRLVGRISISIGRRLGEIYDKIPRFVAAARFSLHPDQVAPVLKGLELDIALRQSMLSSADSAHLQSTINKYFPAARKHAGVGIEIRYNFSPNDSARLRKDVAMARYVKAEKLFPVYLVFSGISPRAEAMSRLKRAGWAFLTGNQAAEFAQALFGLDLASILDEPLIKEEIQREVGAIMSSMIRSYAFQKVLEGYTLAQD